MSRLSVQVGMGPPEATASWQPLRIGAGGWVTGIDIAPDGTMVCRTDTYGAYIWDDTASEWVQLLTATSIGQEVHTYWSTFNAIGAYEVAIAPSDSDVLYMVWNGYVYKSINRGVTWTQTSFTRDTALEANGDTRMSGQHMAVDPADPDTVYFGTIDDGVYYTHDGGSSWSQIASGTIPFGTAAPGHAGIVFDPDSGTNGSGYTNTIYVPSYGNGVWRSTNGGSTWSQIANGTSSPDSVWHAQLAADGIYYCADTSAAWKYASGSWTSINASRSYAVATDPNDAARIVVMGDGGVPLRESLDRGATWVGNDTWWTITRAATDIPWLAWTNEDYMSAGDMRFHPIDGKLYFAEGIGVWKSTFPTTFVPVTFTSQSKGIEQLVANWIWSVPGGALFVTAWDRPIFRSTDPDVFPSTHGPNADHAIVYGASVEHATDDTSFLAVVANGGAGSESSYSEDGGVTWTKFDSIPGWALGGLGHLAVSTTQNMVWYGNQTGAPYYTTNGGTSWTACPSPFNVASPGNPFINRHVVCADRVTANTFYGYVDGGGGGIYRSTNSGASWTNVFSGTLVSSNDGYNAFLRAVPGKAGHLFFTNGSYGGGDHTGPYSLEYFKRSTDGGETWSTVSNVLEVYAFGFGKEKPGGSYPTIFVAGFVNSVFGIWMSDDDCGLWTRLGNTLFPLDSVDIISCCEGDMNIYGRCYVGFKGSGWAYWG